MFTSWLLADIISAEQTARLPRPVPEVELSEEWKNFEIILGKHKHEYVKTLAKLKIQEEAVNKLSNDITALNNCMSSVQSKDFYDEIKSLVDDFKLKNNYTEKVEECAQIAGKVKSMENALVHTNARRYNQFTCSICMDRLIDTFLDPCGHVICRTCHVKSLSSLCPICRTNINAKKIYSTM